MLRRILVALGGTRYTPVGVRYAVELAAAHDAAVTGVTCVDLDRMVLVGPVPMGGGAAAAELVEYRQAVTRERVEAVIAEFEATCRGAGVRYRVEREEGDPFTELRSLWRYHDLTIVGLRGLFEYGLERRPEDYLLDMMEAGVRPILAIPPEHRPVRRALFAYDGSPEAAKAMKQFAAMHLWPDLELHVVTFRGPDGEPQQLLADAADYCAAHGYEASVEHVEAPARDVLLDVVARRGADILVMGASRRAKLLRRTIGDTALLAIRHAEVPLFLSQ